MVISSPITGNIWIDYLCIFIICCFIMRYYGDYEEKK